jgi:hypothetical protein
MLCICNWPAKTGVGVAAVVAAYERPVASAQDLPLEHFAAVLTDLFEGVESFARPPLSFLEIQTSATAPGAFEIVLAGGRCLRVPATFEAESLKRLLAVIEGVAH